MWALQGVTFEQCKCGCLREGADGDAYAPEQAASARPWQGLAPRASRDAAWALDDLRRAGILTLVEQPAVAAPETEVWNMAHDDDDGDEKKPRRLDERTDDDTPPDPPVPAAAAAETALLFDDDAPSPLAARLSQCDDGDVAFKIFADRGEAYLACGKRRLTGVPIWSGRDNAEPGTGTCTVDRSWTTCVCEPTDGQPDDDAACFSGCGRSTKEAGVLNQAWMSWIRLDAVLTLAVYAAAAHASADAPAMRDACASHTGASVGGALAPLAAIVVLPVVSAAHGARELAFSAAAVLVLAALLNGLVVGRAAHVGVLASSAAAQRLCRKRLVAKKGEQSVPSKLTAKPVSGDVATAAIAGGALAGTTVSLAMPLSLCAANACPAGLPGPCCAAAVAINASAGVGAAALTAVVLHAAATAAGGTLNPKKCCIAFFKSKRTRRLAPFATAALALVLFGFAAGASVGSTPPTPEAQAEIDLTSGLPPSQSQTAGERGYMPVAAVVWMTLLLGTVRDAVESKHAFTKWTRASALRASANLLLAVICAASIPGSGYDETPAEASRRAARGQLCALMLLKAGADAAGLAALLSLAASDAFSVVPLVGSVRLRCVPVPPLLLLLRTTLLPTTN